MSAEFQFEPIFDGNAYSSLGTYLRTSRPRLCISSQLRGSICQPCSISSPALASILLALVVRPYAFFCHMVEEHPRTPLDVP